MSIDKMQDVMPLSFDFKRGEQPSAEKLTKWAQLTDIALEKVTQAIGDPWDYQPHYNSSDARFYLSIANLAQTNIARLSGASSLVSPGGNTLGQAMSGDYIVTFTGDRNTWYIGFPLCKSKTSGFVITPTSNDNDLESIDLDSITFTYSGGASATEFTTRKTSIDSVEADGDYYINWRTGVVTSFSVTSSAVRMLIPGSASMQFFGSGAPWTTHNVIPDWEEDAGVTIQYVSEVGGAYTYAITLPEVQALPRVGDLNVIPCSDEASAFGVIAALGSQYRLPYVLNTLGGSELIPEGFIFLWDNETSSIVNLTSFSTGASPNHLTTLSMTHSGQLPGVLLSGAPNSSRYRIITVGSSLAEQIGWLTAVVRDNTHSGISSRSRGVINNTLAYTPPIKHRDLADRYGVAIDIPSSDTSYLDKIKFTESKYPTNDHSQYLHRGGFMKSDTGNSKNAMRGHLAFAAVDSFNIDTTGTTAGILTNTYGVTFGGGEVISSSEYAGPPRLTWEGGKNLTPQSVITEPANRLAFGIRGIGINHSSFADYWGALTYTSYRNAPLYLRGNADGDPSYNGIGGTIAFDMGQNAELNYLTIRRNPTYNDPHIPTQTTGQVDASTPSTIMPSASGKISYQQIREFRFRSVAFVSSALNTSNLSESDTTVIPELSKYFVGPSVVGTDFLNLYSNAIFFSNDGDGTQTMMHSSLSDWLDNPSSNDRPAGIYYEPNGLLTKMRFTISDGSLNTHTSAYFGYTRNNYYYSSSNSGGTQDTTGIYGDIGGTGPRTYIELETTFDGPDGDPLYGDISIAAGRDINLYATQALEIRAVSGNLDLLSSSGDISIVSSNGDMEITAEDNTLFIGGQNAYNITDVITMRAGTGIASTHVPSSGEILIESENSIRVYPENNFTVTADNNINLNAGDEVSIDAPNGFYLGTAGDAIAEFYSRRIKFTNLPSSDSGLTVGTIYDDGSGFLKIKV